MAGWYVLETSGWRRTPTAPDAWRMAVEFTEAGECLLLAPADCAASVNGMPMVTGARALRHKDRVRGPDGAAAYHTDEEPPGVAAFAGLPVRCGRCHGAITEGALTVRCGCGAYYHHGDCYAYPPNPVCVNPHCRRPTRLDGSALWRPEEEE